MAKKKGASRGDDNDDEKDEVESTPPAQQAGGKGKKKGKKGKGRDDFDDDFQVEPEEEEGLEVKLKDVEPEEQDNAEVKPKEALVKHKAGGGGKKKKGKGRDDFDDDFKVELEEEDESEAKPKEDKETKAKAGAGSKKKKGKGRDDFDDDFKVEPEEEDESDGKSKAGGGGKKKRGKGQDDFDDDFKVEPEEEDMEAKAKAGGVIKKKKGKKGRGNDESDDEEDAEKKGATGRAKKKKGRRAGDWSNEEEDVAPKIESKVKKAASAFALLDIEDQEESEEDEPEPVSNGKAKKAAAFAVLEEEESEEEEDSKPAKKLNGFAGLSLEDEDKDVEAAHLVVGEVEAVEKIKKADKLRLCHVSIGEDEPIQIVCGGKNIREGLKVIVAPVGSTIPSNGMEIKKTTIKGMESFGMICGAAEMGWVGPSDEAVVLGPDAVVGQRAPLTRPSDEEEEDELLAFTSKKKRKGAAKGVEVEQEEERPVFAGKKKKKGGKAEPIEESEEGEAPALSKKEAPKEEDMNGEGEETAAFSGKKKKKGKKAAQDHFDEEFSVEADQPFEAEETLVLGGKKKKKGKTAAQDDFDKGFEERTHEAAEEPEVLVLDAKKKKKGKNAVRDEVDKGFEMETDAPAEEEEETLVLDGKRKKKGKKAAQNDFDKDFEMEEATEEPDSAPAPQDGEKRGKKGKGKKEDEDIEAILAQLEAPKKDEDEAAGGKKKKKKAKKGKDEKEEEDLDALLAELDGPKKEEAARSAEGPPEAEEVGPSRTEAQEAGPPAEDEKEGDENLSAAAKKKKKKKEKEKEKKSADKAAVVEDDGAKEEEAKKKKAAADKKLPLHVRQMQERLAKLQAEEEHKKKEEEERQRKEEEEAARLAELERQKEEAKLRKKQKEKEKREQLKKEGKLLTGKQKEEAKRLAAVREQMLKQAGLKMDGEEAAPKKQKVVYGTKKNRQQSKQAAEAAAPKQLSPEPEPEAEPMEEETPEPEPVREVSPPLEEAKAPEPPAEDEEEDEDWDAKSWDEEEVAKTLKKTGAFRDEDEHDEPKRVASTKPAPKKEESAKAFEPSKPSTSRPAVLHKAAPRWKQAEESSEEESKSESNSEEDSSDDEEDRRKAEARKKREERMKEAMAKRDENDLRSPICCILGHVDTGKTKLLDRIRNTNVQEGEAGGITQQIGATFFPMDAIKERTKELKADATLKVPGLLIIDTPGHESFTNLRSRGSGLCDIAILVVDIMHGLEPQTVESINLLKMRKTPFIIALNKVDRLYDWKVQPNAPIRNALKGQAEHVRNEFDRRAAEAIAMLQEQGLNSALYWKNNDPRRVISIVPTSAISGEGIPDMLLLLVQMTQKMMSEKLMYLSETQCTVLEVKVIEGLGTTIDVVLVNGILREGDTIIVCGLQGPIKTTIRALLTPHPMKELRVKGSYVHHKELKAAQGIKITAQGLESAVAGTQLYVVGPEDDADELMDEAMQDMNSILSRVDKSGEGVCVQASTLGSLEALLEFLKSPDVNIPVSGINIGPVHKKDVMRASVMLERKRKEFACILAFDVKVTPEAREMAEDAGVKVFTADIIYHLFDQFTAYMSNIKAEKRAEAEGDAVFPCILKILPQFIFNKKDPIVLGCEVVAGIAKVGTPICVPTKGNIDIGKIASIENNHKAVETAKKGQSIALKIQSTNAEEAQKSYGRHFDKDDELVSHISRKSIDLLKENYKDDLSREDWMLVVRLKKMFDIQ